MCKTAWGKKKREMPKILDGHSKQLAQTECVTFTSYSL